MFADCPSSIEDKIVNANPAREPPQFNSPGKLGRNNGGALFSNHASISRDAVCDVKAQWIISDNPEYYTSISKGIE